MGKAAHSNAPAQTAMTVKGQEMCKSEKCLRLLSRARHHTGDSSAEIYFHFFHRSNFNNACGRAGHHFSRWASRGRAQQNFI